MILAGGLRSGPVASHIVTILPPRLGGGAIRRPTGSVLASMKKPVGGRVRLDTQRRFSGRTGRVGWTGHHVTDHGAFEAFLAGPVRARVQDEDFHKALKEEMRALETTGMDLEVIESFLSQAPPVLDWEVGEALAECFLTEEPDWQAVWPSNPRRDRRSPRASLPGADLVGFKTAHGDVLFLFGEVKTSSDARTPPGVMNGRNAGLAYQIETQTHPLSLEHATLLKWLWDRCEDPANAAFFKQAAQRYLASGGRDLLLTGMLMRDTDPDERDLKAKGESLGQSVLAPTQIEFIALYAPRPIDAWPALVNGSTP